MVQLCYHSALICSSLNPNATFNTQWVGHLMQLRKTVTPSGCNLMPVVVCHLPFAFALYLCPSLPSPPVLMHHMLTQMESADLKLAKYATMLYIYS